MSVFTNRGEIRQGEERKGPEPRNPGGLVLFSAVGSAAGTLSTLSALCGRQVGEGEGEVLPTLRICEWRPDSQSAGNISAMESIPWDSPAEALITFCATFIPVQLP